MRITKMKEVFSEELEGEVVHLLGTLKNGEKVDEVLKVERVNAFEIDLLGFGRTFTTQLRIEQFQQIGEPLTIKIMKPDKGVKE